MGTEVLRPQDSLIDRTRIPPVTFLPRRRSIYNNNNNYHYNSQPTRPSRSKPAPVRVNQKKKAVTSSPMISRRYSSEDLRHSKHNHNNHNNYHHHQFLMGQVTVLRRGEPLDLRSQTAKGSAVNDLIVSGTERLGPDPAIVSNQIRIKDTKAGNRSRSLSPKPVAVGLPDVYAGSAISVSPSPESLPLPSFSKKKQVSMTVDDSATRDLRRLLRLD